MGLGPFSAWTPFNSRRLGFSIPFVCGGNRIDPWTIQVHRIGVGILEPIGRKHRIRVDDYSSAIERPPPVTYFGGPEAPHRPFGVVPVSFRQELREGSRDYRELVSYGLVRGSEPSGADTWMSSFALKSNAGTRDIEAYSRVVVG